MAGREDFRPRFNPEGPLWETNKHLAVYGGGESTLLMQFAYPPVAQAIHDDPRRYFLNHPRERLQQTADYGHRMIFGSAEDSIGAAEEINRMHTHVSGVLKETVGAHRAGEPYSAFDQEGLAWVAATLMRGSIEGYRKFVGPLTQQQEDRYVEEAKQLFTMVRLDRDSLPDTYEGIKAYMQDMIDSERVKVGSLARLYSKHVLLQARAGRDIPGTNVVFRGLYWTAYDLLPPELREQYEFEMPSWEVRIMHQSEKAVRRITPYLPDRLKYVHGYRNGQEQLHKNRQIDL